MKRLPYFILCLLFLLSAYTLLAQEQQLKVTKIAPKVYVHTSYKQLGAVVYPSHGLIVSTKDGVVLIDTGWGNAPTEQLLEWIANNLKQPVKVCIPTHFHDDKMGGISVLQKRGIPVVASVLTARLAAEHNAGTPDITFATDTTLTAGGQQIEVHYPGAGHTTDNIVVYLPKHKLLFGGCLVKDIQAKSLGNIADADLDNWPETIRGLQKRYTKAKIVVPSHGPWGSKAALEHTLYLLGQATKKQP